MQDFRPLVERARQQTRRAVPQVVRRRFWLKVGVLVFGVMLVVSVSGIAIYAQADAAIQRSTETRLEGLAEQKSSTLTEWNQRMKLQATSLAASDKMATQDYEYLGRYLPQYAATLPEYVAAVHVVDTSSAEVLASSEGEDVAGTNYGEMGANWVDRLSFVKPDTAIRSPLYEDSVVDAPVIAYVVQIEGNPGAAVVMLVDLRKRSAGLTRTSERVGVTVVDTEGTVVLDADTDRIGAQNVPGGGVDSPAVTKGFEDERGYEEVEMDGQRRAVGYAPVPFAEWVVLTSVPAGQVSDTGSLILSSVVGMILVASLALLAVAVVIGRGTAGDLRDLAATARRLEAGELDAEVATTREDELGDLYRSFDAMRTSLRSRIEEAEHAREQAESAREESAALNRHLEEKAGQYSNVMEAVAAGDFTARLDPQGRSEAMGDVATAFNAMLDDIEGVVEQGKAFADAVAASSEEVTASSEEVEASAQQVADAVQEISDGAERQDRQLQTVAEEMNHLSTTIEEIAASADEVADVAEETAEVGESGRESAERAIEEMRTVEREADGTVAEMDALQDRIREIEEVTDFIQEVADQTNILALNANIEAARAGEAGKGFAVVADQVKELAEETREATEDIEDHVAAVQEQTQVTAEEVRTTSDVVGDTADIVREAADALEEIAGYAEETNVGVQEISDGTTQQATSTNEVVSVVDDVANIAEQTADEASNVAGATEEQTAALSEMTSSAGSLTTEADTLRQTLERFETGGSERGEPPGENLGVVEGEDD